MQLSFLTRSHRIVDSSHPATAILVDGAASGAGLAAAAAAAEAAAEAAAVAGAKAHKIQKSHSFFWVPFFLGP